MIDFMFIKEWIKNRLVERTTWDGIVLVAAGLAYLMLGPVAKLIAYAAIAYGLWTIWQEQK